MPCLVVLIELEVLCLSGPLTVRRWLVRNWVRGVAREKIRQKVGGAARPQRGEAAEASESEDRATQCGFALRPR
jgi:hypothetical protein